MSRVWIVAVVVAAVACSNALTSGAATSSTVVTMTVPSATRLVTTGCATNTSNVTSFGVVQPDTGVVTTLDCDVAFGSSNDTAQLRLRQTDAAGLGMWMPTRGILDTAFDGPSGTANGAVIHPIGAGQDYVSGMVAQPDRKLVVAGTCSSNFCLARFDPDTGALDPTWDGPGAPGDGAFIHSMTGSTDTLEAVAIQPDGMIVAAGTCASDFCLARFTDTGALDPDFDGPSGTANGAFTDPIGASLDEPSSVQVLADGRILVAGACYVGATQHHCLARYNADGSRDLTFDGPAAPGNGKFIATIGTNSSGVTAAVVHADGTTTATGWCTIGGTYSGFCPVRYTATGALDATFDGPSGTADGAFVLTIGPTDDSSYAIIESTTPGGVIVAGQCFNAGVSYEFCVARLAPDGSLDATFDGPSGTADGAFMLSTGTGWDAAQALVLQDDGMLVMSGRCGGGSDQFCLARVDENGMPDAAFDGPAGTGNGSFRSPIGVSDTSTGVALRSDGRLVAAGNCNNGADRDFCLMAFDTGGTISDYVTGGGTDRDWSSGSSTNMFGACLRAVSGGASATWALGDPCPQTDGPTWNDVPASFEKVAVTTALEPDPVDATAHIRFGVRTSLAQPPGDYVAPITFEVLAPDA